MLNNRLENISNQDFEDLQRSITYLLFQISELSDKTIANDEEIKLAGTITGQTQLFTNIAPKNEKLIMLQQPQQEEYTYGQPHSNEFQITNSSSNLNSETIGEENGSNNELPVQQQPYNRVFERYIMLQIANITINDRQLQTTRAKINQLILPTYRKFKNTISNFNCKFLKFCQKEPIQRQFCQDYGIEWNHVSNYFGTWKDKIRPLTDQTGVSNVQLKQLLQRENETEVFVNGNFLSCFSLMLNKFKLYWFLSGNFVKFLNKTKVGRGYQEPTEQKLKKSALAVLGRNTLGKLAQSRTFI